MSTTTTPTSGPRHTRSRSPSRTRIPSRPTTPLRPSSRSSLRTSQQAIAAASYSTNTHSLGDGYQHDGALDEHGATLALLEPAFAELSDGMADLEANLMHMQLMHESLSRFSESFASFLYGMNMNAFCVDFPEAPVAESFARADRLEERFAGLGMGSGAAGGGMGGEIDNTFLTTDTSFVEHPPLSSKASSKPSTPKVGRTRGGTTGQTRGSTRGRGIPRASGIARGVGRGRGRGGSTR